MKNLKYDTIIIGAGLAGCNMALTLHKKGERVLLIGHPNGDRCSSVAAGLMNPIVPKGIASTWKRNEVFDLVPGYYRQFEELLKTELVQPINILQLMSNDSMQEEWLNASRKKENHGWVVEKESGIFEITSVYRLDVGLFLNRTKNFFMERGCFVEMDVNHADIHCSDLIGIANYEAEKLLFCEGHDHINNPFFNYLPLTISSGVIGEYKLEHNLSNNHIIRRKKWSIPTGEKTYLVGSTFLSNDFSVSPTAEERAEIEQDLNLWTESNELVELKKGLRPTIGDRRPLLGKHPDKSNMFIYNGLGSKGCSLSALLCPMLADYMMKGKGLLKDVDISRFDYTA